MAQTLTRNLLHFIFSTKNRVELISPAIAPELYAYMGGICRNLDSPLLAMAGMSDHVHMLISMSKKICMMDLMMHVKKDSSKWIKTKGDEFARFRWRDGYAGLSIGESGIEGLKRYMRDQTRHHASKTFKQELIEF